MTARQRVIALNAITKYKKHVATYGSSRDQIKTYKSYYKKLFSSGKYSEQDAQAIIFVYRLLGIVKKNSVRPDVVDLRLEQFNALKQQIVPGTLYMESGNLTLLNNLCTLYEVDDGLRKLLEEYLVNSEYRTGFNKMDIILNYDQLKSLTEQRMDEQAAARAERERARAAREKEKAERAKEKAELEAELEAIRERAKAQLAEQKAERERAEAWLVEQKAAKEKEKAEREKEKAERAAEREKAKAEREKAKADREKAKAEREKAKAEREKAKADVKVVSADKQDKKTKEIKAKSNDIEYGSNIISTAEKEKLYRHVGYRIRTFNELFNFDISKVNSSDKVKSITASYNDLFKQTEKKILSRDKSELSDWVSSDLLMLKIERQCILKAIKERSKYIKVYNNFLKKQLKQNDSIEESLARKKFVNQLADCKQFIAYVDYIRLSLGLSQILNYVYELVYLQAKYNVQVMQSRYTRIKPFLNSDLYKWFITDEALKSVYDLQDIVYTLQDSGRAAMGEYLEKTLDTQKIQDTGIQGKISSLTRLVIGKIISTNKILMNNTSLKMGSKKQRLDLFMSYLQSQQIMQNEFEKDRALNIIANNLRLREDQKRITAVYKLLQNVQLAHDKYIRFYDLQLVMQNIQIMLAVNDFQSDDYGIMLCICQEDIQDYKNSRYRSNKYTYTNVKYNYMKYERYIKYDVLPKTKESQDYRNEIYSNEIFRPRYRCAIKRITNGLIDMSDKNFLVAYPEIGLAGINDEDLGKEIIEYSENFWIAVMYEVQYIQPLWKQLLGDEQYN